MVFQGSGNYLDIITKENIYSPRMTFSEIIEKAPSSQFTRVHLNEKNHDGSCCTLDIDIDKAGGDPAFRDDGLHLPGDVVEAIVGGGGYVDGLLQMP